MITVTITAILGLAKRFLADTPESANRDASMQLMNLVIEADSPLAAPLRPRTPYRPNVTLNRDPLPSGPPRYVSPPVMAGGFGQERDEISVALDSGISPVADITVNDDGTWISTNPAENEMLTQLNELLVKITGGHP